MENIFYSSSVCAFYYYPNSSEDLPSDAKEISQDVYLSLISAQESGKTIVAGEDGFPIAIDNNAARITPSQVTRAQGKAALIRAGLWNGVVDFVNSISDPVEKAVAEVALNDTTHWQRSSPFLNSAAEALGLTDEQLDQLFIDASKIEL